MRMIRSLSAIAAAAALVVAGSPAVAKNKSTPKAATVRSISASDKAQGAKAHPQLLEEFGGAYTGPQAAYVEKVGKKISVQSGLSNSEKDFTVTLLNSSVNNAFAIPGGYVYVTRQLLALMNDEAELASVLGHETGHVAARHSNKRNTTSTLGTLLAAGLGMVTGSSEIGQLAGYGAQLVTLKFSRTQEYQADDLGIRYLAGAGYDPLASADMLASLNAMSSVDARAMGSDGKGVPTWASTHPNTADRVARARKQAAATGSSAKGGRDHNAFLAMLDGMIYDDDPKQGIVDGSTFRHPELKIAFTAPQGFALINSPQAVVVNGSGAQAQFQGGALGGGGLPAYIDARFQALGGGQTKVNYGDVKTTSVNGIDAAYATATASTQSGPVDVTIFAYRFTPETAYHFMTITAQGSGLGVFKPLVESFKRLSDADAAAIKPRRVKIVTVAKGDTVTSLSERMAYPSLKLERFLALNALAADAKLQVGQKVKLIVVG